MASLTELTNALFGEFNTVFNNEYNNTSSRDNKNNMVIIIRLKLKHQNLELHKDADSQSPPQIRNPNRKCQRGTPDQAFGSQKKIDRERTHGISPHGGLRVGARSIIDKWTQLTEDNASGHDFIGLQLRNRLSYMRRTDEVFSKSETYELMKKNHK